MFKLQYCTKFGQLILWKIIIKIVVTICHIFRLKSTKFDFGWGSAPNSAGGAHSAPPCPLTGFDGVLPLREGKGGRGREGERLCHGFWGMDALADRQQRHANRQSYCVQYKQLKRDGNILKQFSSDNSCKPNYYHNYLYYVLS